MKGMPVRRFFSAIGLAAAMGVAAFLINGCTATSGIEASARVSDDGSQANKSIIINNRALARDIEISNMKSIFAGDLLKVQVSLHSKNRDTVPIQYRFEWFDAQGFEINANQAWKPLMLYGKEIKTIQGVAPDPRAKEFKLKLRDPDAGTSD